MVFITSEFKSHNCFHDADFFLILKYFCLQTNIQIQIFFCMNSFVIYCFIMVTECYIFDFRHVSCIYINSISAVSTFCHICMKCATKWHFRPFVNEGLLLFVISSLCFTILLHYIMLMNNKLILWSYSSLISKVCFRKLMIFFKQ